MSLIFWTYKDAKTDAAGGGGDGNVVLGNHPSFLRKFGKDVGIVLSHFRSERFDSHQTAQRFEVRPPLGSPFGGAGHPDARQYFRPNNGGHGKLGDSDPS